MMKKHKTLKELFSFPGFKAANQLEGKFGEPKARIITLTRQKKLLYAPDARKNTRLAMTVKFVKYAIWMRLIIEYIFATKDGAYPALGVKVCV
jgi:hypothetical protein